MLIIFPDLRHYCAKCLSCPVTSNSGRYSFLKSPWLRCAENITLPKLRAALRLSCAWLSQKLLQMFLLELVKLQQQFRSIRSASSISNVTHWKREVIYLNRTYSLNSFKCLVFVLLAVRFCLPLRFVLFFSQPAFPILSYLSFLFTVILLSFLSSSLLGVVTALWTAWAEYVSSLLVISIATRSVVVRIVLQQLGPVLPRSIKASISASIRWVSVPSPNSACVSCPLGFKWNRIAHLKLTKCCTCAWFIASRFRGLPRKQASHTWLTVWVLQFILQDFFDGKWYTHEWICAQRHVHCIYTYHSATCTLALMLRTECFWPWKLPYGFAGITYKWPLSNMTHKAQQQKTNHWSRLSQSVALDVFF